ncbi:hypothetical protein PQU96_12760 [Vogesella sp. LYT5W]|uniref:Uncharacterized protein n=1 Tax=Vogesella margarita TaxID=2984199 RepID=A0ABT5IR10_9NEIS|nr:hypothetical protein [Vogesella margarita]MDC7714984.1 hypothetical protein [Vogesella margarita]
MLLNTGGTSHLTLLEALSRQLAFGSVDEFYYLARTILIKDEKYYDRFDPVFGHCFNGLSLELEDLQTAIPEDWLRKQVEKFLSDEEKRQLQALGWDKLMQTLRERLAEQKERHQGGNKWIGTGGTSPFGAYGYHPVGYPHRAAGIAPPACGQGVGSARVPQSRRPD